MYLIFIFILLSYVIYFVYVTRSYVLDGVASKRNDFYALENQFQNLSTTKNDLSSDKLFVEDESMKIYTLFELTKEITKSLNEDEAFLIFKQKLSDNVTFNDCQLFDMDANVKSFRESPKYIVYTLRLQRRKIGYLVIEGVKEEEREKAFILCYQYALALRRVRLYKEIEKTAITDSLTGLYTRRYVLDRLEEELKRSKEKKMQFAFLMMDVDHFKKFNDSYGHLTGDLILKEVGNLVKGNIREIDIPGRFGGEEFCVLLPDTDLDGARYAAERIRQAVAEEKIKAYDHVVEMTLSIGIAIYPDDTTKSGDLVEKADATLYQAKKNGRNQVCHYGQKEQA